MTAVVVLGMHRSGTSAVAGMIASAGLASAGEAVRNWDNARGHHEMLDLVRLNERVLAASGGSWLKAPRELVWSDADARERDRLLALRVDGRPALLKDPRMLLVWPFWQASQVPMRVVAVVRHPVAVARSLASWRGMSLAEVVALWIAHNRPMVNLGAPMVNFDAADVPAQLAAALGADLDALSAGFDPALVHHDGALNHHVPGLAEALELYRALGGVEPISSRGFPHAAIDELHRTGSLDAARAALAAEIEISAVIVPVVVALYRQQQFADAIAMVDEHEARLEPRLSSLLYGKIAMAMGHGTYAVEQLQRALDAAEPFFQARHLLPHALRTIGRNAEAYAAMEQLATVSIYPHNPLSTVAEWRHLDGDVPGALAAMARAIDAAPAHRRGRLRTRRAEWLRATDVPAADRELELAVVEDPGYARAAELLAEIRRSMT